MGRGRKKRKGRKQNQGLSGVGQVMDHPIAQTLTKGGLIVLAAIAAGGVGAALGRHSLLAGIPIALVGYHKKNPYVIAAGLGLTLSNGFQNKKKVMGTQGVDGFDLKAATEQAKDRVGTFFKNFSEKLYLDKGTVSGTDGLEGESKEEQVTYFVNPYSSKELDTSAIDRIQEQIAQMNQGANGLNEVDREF